MSYTIGSDGVVTAELDKLLQFIERRVSGLGFQAQASDTGVSTVASTATTTPPYSSGQACVATAGHDWCVVILAIVAGAVAGYFAGKCGARRVIESVKIPHV